MMLKKKKQNKTTKIEARSSSLTLKWLSLVAATITVSFVVFSILIYSLVRQQLIEQEENFSQNIIGIFEQRLVNIPNHLEIYNVVPKLSPGTNKIIEGESPNQNDNENYLDNDILATVASQDTSILIFNTDKEIIFSNGAVPENIDVPKFEHNNIQKYQYDKNKLNLYIYQKIYSDRTGKLTGYLLVVNSMSKVNRVLDTLRGWMVILSFIAIIIFIILSYLIVNGVVQPIKRMSKISRAVNEDPNSLSRMPDLKRNDELGELASNFNQMLDRMQAYIQQQKQFVGDVSHELRTPMAVIQGHLNLLKRWGKDDPQILEESIDASLQESNRMKHLIQEMLDLTRAEQVDTQFPDETSDVNEILNRTISDMQMIHQDFTIIYSQDALQADTRIKMYRNHLEQVLIILIDNAIKYSDMRKEVLVEAITEENTVEITVQDFGEGIAKAEQDKIFNRFYRVDKARTREKGGNGLGLAIAQKLTESYGGNISVISQLGSGSKFKVVFPLLKIKNSI